MTEHTYAGAAAIPLVLASGSPRRSELLRRLAVPFEVRPAAVPEDVLPGESAWSSARRLALLKLGAAMVGNGSRLVLAADTVVDLDGYPFGKPGSPAEALEMLGALRGRWHRVLTAVALGRPDLIALVVVSTEVLMRAYSSEETSAYVASGAPLDKAGAYAIQDEEFHPVLEYRGSYTNVVGLPLEATGCLLRAAGLPVEAPAHSLSSRSPHGDLQDRRRRHAG